MRKGPSGSPIRRGRPPRFFGELAPVGTSGLVPPTFDIAYSEAKDLEASVEYELGKNTFVRALGGYEKLSDLISDNSTSQLWYGRFALNQILGRIFCLLTAVSL